MMKLPEKPPQDGLFVEMQNRLAEQKWERKPAGLHRSPSWNSGFREPWTANRSPMSFANDLWTISEHKWEP